MRIWSPNNMFLLCVCGFVGSVCGCASERLIAMLCSAYHAYCIILFVTWSTATAAGLAHHHPHIISFATGGPRSSPLTENTHTHTNTMPPSMQTFCLCSIRTILFDFRRSPARRTHTQTLDTPRALSELWPTHAHTCVVYRIYTIQNAYAEYGAPYAESMFVCMNTSYCVNPCQAITFMMVWCCGVHTRVGAQPSQTCINQAYKCGTDDFIFIWFLYPYVHSHAFNLRFCCVDVIESIIIVCVCVCVWVRVWCV